MEAVTQCSLPPWQGRRKGNTEPTVIWWTLACQITATLLRDPQISLQIHTKPFWLDNTKGRKHSLSNHITQHLHGSSGVESPCGEVVVSSRQGFMSQWRKKMSGRTVFCMASEMQAIKQANTTALHIHKRHSCYLPSSLVRSSLFLTHVLIHFKDYQQRRAEKCFKWLCEFSINRVTQHGLTRCGGHPTFFVICSFPLIQERPVNILTFLTKI